VERKIINEKNSVEFKRTKSLIGKAPAAGTHVSPIFFREVEEWRRKKY
jgi:hypothetical protein